MSFKPTNQQTACVETYGKKESFKVEAVAGSGKTSTVELMANSDDTRSALYLAFNKASADEAGTKMPFHVICKTTHSIAYRIFGVKYKDKLSRPRSGYVNMAGTVGEITKFFNVKSSPTLTKNAISRLAKQTVSAFESSAAFDLTSKHVPMGDLNALKEKTESKAEVFDMDSAIKHVMKIAKLLWEGRVDLTSKVLITHDTYLKLYQLSKPVLEYDVIFLDEAQDTSDCVIDIVMRQTEHAQVVCVGDSFQAIYGWRGAVNALGKIKSQSTPLSKSFRYGPKVAAVATAILNGAMIVEGFDKIPTEIGEVDRDMPYTMLFRTNAMLIAEGLSLIEQGVSVDIAVDTRDFIKKLDSAIELHKGNAWKAKHEDICVFDKWSDLLIEAEIMVEVEEEDLGTGEIITKLKRSQGNGKGELGRIAMHIENGEAFDILRILRSYTRPKTPHVTLITAHRSKGMEYPQVVLANDFPKVTNEEGDFMEPNDMERNLLYVASTRAQGCLELNQTVEDIIAERESDVDTSYKAELECLKLVHVVAGTQPEVIDQAFNKLIGEELEEFDVFGFPSDLPF